MIIHIVQPGETISSIATYYGVTDTKLIQDNELEDASNLVPGQTIVIVYPLQVYTVQEGDSLIGIANAYNVSVLQLLRNNPYLSNQEYLYPGDTIVISYNNNKRIITTNGYANTFIDPGILRKTLPFLTYLSIFGYRTTAEVEIIGDNDSEVIKISKEYGVAPIMMLSTLTFEGIGSYEAVYTILSNDELINRHINNILTILKTKGYYGINTTFSFFNEQNRLLYENYITKLTNQLNQEGFQVFVTITPEVIINVNEITFSEIDYSILGKEANGFTIMNYNWGYNFGPPLPVISVSGTAKFLDYAVNLVPPAKIDTGFTVLGYDWELPYVIGYSRAVSLTLNSAINLAREVGATIQFEEISQTPFFEYIENRSGVPIRHIVRFIDARSIDAMLNLVVEYGIKGVGIWNIMNYSAQTWLVINTQYEIEKINPADL
jgi:spore germination protein